MKIEEDEKREWIRWKHKRRGEARKKGRKEIPYENLREGNGREGKERKGIKVSKWKGRNGTGRRLIKKRKNKARRGKLNTTDSEQNYNNLEERGKKQHEREINCRTDVLKDIVTEETIPRQV